MLGNCRKLATCLWSAVVLSLLTSRGLAQITWPEHEPEHFSDPFAQLWDALDALREGGDRELSILYIGGSHVQSGWLGHGLRAALQEWASEATGSRGLILPYRLTRTNTPTHFRTAYSGDWNGHRCTRNAEREVCNESRLATGILVTSESGGTLQHVCYFPDSTRCLISELEFWTNASIDGWEWTGNGSLQSAVALDQADGWRLAFDPPADTLGLAFHPTEGTPTWYAGATLVASTSGPRWVVHEWGHNGLRMEHAQALGGWERLLDRLQPDLVLVGIGVNDAMDGAHFNQQAFYHSGLAFLERLKTSQPAILLLGTTPANPQHKALARAQGLVNQSLQSLAQTADCAYVDLTFALGGDDAWEACQMAGYLQPDGVHLTESGYLRVSSIVFEALEASYLAQCAP